MQLVIYVHVEYPPTDHGAMGFVTEEATAAFRGRTRVSLDRITEYRYACWYRLFYNLVRTYHTGFFFHGKRFISYAKFRTP